MAFETERDAFKTFAENIAKKPQVLAQFEQAIEQIFWTYDTSIRENRFTVGGVIEYVMGAALRACGVPVHHKGIVDSDIDLLLDESERGFSIKAILKGAGTRLVNTMGAQATEDRWRTATIFIIYGAGIVYVDPELDWWVEHRRRCIGASGDAITVKKRCVLDFAESHPEWVVPCRLPNENDRESRSHPARTHAADIAAQVLIHYPELLKEFANLRPGEELSDVLKPD